MATGGDMAASGNSKVQRLIQSAEELARKGDRQKALTEFHKVLDIEPDNREAKKRILELEREVAAMRNFRKTRDSRTHKTGKSVSSDDFVAECITRSEEAFNEGDEVRALQELERAKRHDPDNKAVRVKILTVRRQIKTDNLYDLALAKLRDGDPATAVRNARTIFEEWPSSPVLSKLLDEIEGHKSTVPMEEIEEIEEIEEFELEDSLEEETVPVSPPEPVKKPEKKPEKKTRETTSPAEAAITSIRAKISRSDYAGALAEAKKASKNHPGNPTIKELLARLESLAGEKKTEAVPVAPPPEKAPEKKKKSLLPIIIAAAVVIALVVVFVVVKPFGGGGPAEEPVVLDVFEPYSVSFAVEGPENYSVIIDGESIPVLPDGTFSFQGDSEQPRTIEVRASGYETYTDEIAFQSGSQDSMAITLDTLGTSTVQIDFQANMPEGDEQPAEGAITWLVDGEEAETGLQIPTGIHVFQAVLEGYNSVPESILVDRSTAPLQLSLALLSQTESQIILALGVDIPVAGNFAIDGERVGTGVRRISEVLPYGTHTLAVDVEGYEPWTRTITLGEGGYSATVAPEQIVTTGRLLIAPEPWANVTIDGSSLGQTPMAPIDLEEGSHTVLLTNPDYEDQTVTVNIVAGEDTSIRYTAAAAEPEGPEIIEEEQPVIPPFPISQVGPETPNLARQMGDVHGYVTLEVLVGTDGSVRNVNIVNDELGLGCGAAAQAAVRQWVFNPATQGGVPVELTTQVQVRFDIE